MRRDQTSGKGRHSADCRRRMEAVFARDEEFKVEQANFQGPAPRRRSRTKQEETPRNDKASDVYGQTH